MAAPGRRGSERETSLQRDSPEEGAGKGRELGPARGRTPARLPAEEPAVAAPEGDPAPEPLCPLKDGHDALEGRCLGPGAGESEGGFAKAGGEEREQRGVSSTRLAWQRVQLGQGYSRTPRVLNGPLFLNLARNALPSSCPPKRTGTVGPPAGSELPYLTRTKGLAVSLWHLPTPQSEILAFF